MASDEIISYESSASKLFMLTIFALGVYLLTHVYPIYTSKPCENNIKLLNSIRAILILNIITIVLPVTFLLCSVSCSHPVNLLRTMYPMTILFMGIILLFYGIRIGKEKFNTSKIPWKLLLAAGILDVVAFTTYNMAVSKYDVSFVSVISSASPLVTVVLASIVFKEVTTTVQKIGIALIILGVIGLQLASV